MKPLLIVSTLLASVGLAAAQQVDGKTTPSRPAAMVQVEAERPTLRLPEALRWWMTPAPLRTVETARGLGFVARSDGVVVTDRSLVDGADRLHVRLSDGRRLRGEIVSVHTATHTALLRVEAGALPTLAFARRLTPGASLRLGSAPAAQSGISAGAAAAAGALSVLRTPSLTCAGAAGGQVLAWADAACAVTPGMPLLTADGAVAAVGLTALSVPLPAPARGTIHLVAGRAVTDLEAHVAALPPAVTTWLDLIDELRGDAWKSLESLEEMGPSDSLEK